ncbi:MAG: GTPase ObgE [Phycisphaerae bacterium]
MFIDEAEIYVRGGDGGHGCASFRREKYIPRGGPDGGDGGNGGNVVLRAVAGIDTLLDFVGKHHWRAENGRPGEGKEKTGRGGRDLQVELPPGTLVYDRETGVLLKDLTPDGTETVIAAGGRGGRGNKKFATSTHQTPRECEPGQPGEERWLKLELKLIADVGLVGMPNAGKSTLLSRLSKARPKIADYPFTTLKPQLGIVELPGYRRFVMADLPGLIEGAHRGTGLGDAFLRHIERTHILLHLVDVNPPEGEPSPIQAYRAIRKELAAYSPELAAKPELVAATKVDLSPERDGVQALADQVDGQVLAISAVSGTGLDELLDHLWRQVRPLRQAPPSPEPLPLPPHLRNPEADPR